DVLFLVPEVQEARFLRADEADHAWYVRPVEVGVEQSDALALIAQCEREIERNRRLPHSTLAGRDGDATRHESSLLTRRRIFASIRFIESRMYSGSWRILSRTYAQSIERNCAAATASAEWNSIPSASSRDVACRNRSRYRSSTPIMRTAPFPMRSICVRSRSPSSFDSGISTATLPITQ